jgi:hypothetical protein
MSAQMTIQLIGILVLAYIVSRFVFLKKINLVAILDGLIFTGVSLLLILQTGGLRSPIFYLLYILLFGLSLLFEPLPTISLALGLTVFFFQQVINLNDLLQILGLVIITPVAMFFSHQYLELEENRKRITIIKRKQINLEKETHRDEENILLWLDLGFKRSLEQIVDSSSNLMADIGKLTPFQKENLEKIHQSSQELLKLGDRLKNYFAK